MASPPGTVLHNGVRGRQFAPSETNREVRRTTSKPLNFNQAMSDFTTMFPELDRDVIETVLRANNGVVQMTIDQLLMLQESTISQAKPIGTALPSYDNVIGLKGEEPPPAYSDIWQDVQAPFTTETDSTSCSSHNRFWNAPLVGKLPDDFLRLGPECSTSQVSSTPVGATASEDFMTEDEIERFLEDEKLALFLQNEEFIRELRRNREFVSSLEADHRKVVEESGISPSTTNSVPSGGARPRIQGSQDDAAFKHKLKHMGKSTRKKFGKMAKKFTRTKNFSSKLPPMMHGGESTFNLLEEDETDENINKNYLGLDGIQEDDVKDEEMGTYAGNLKTDEEEERLKRMRAGRTGRQLPKPPTSQSSVNDEPIVFYSEDNEFSYKSDC